MITGKMITWVTQPRGVTWNLEMTDDNTLTLTGRVIGNRGGGGGGGAPAGDGAPRGARRWWRTRSWPSATDCSASCEVNQISHKAQKAQSSLESFVLFV